MFHCVRCGLNHQFEVWRALDLGKPIEMGFPRAEAERFVSALRSLETNVEQIVEQKVDVTNAEATRASDLKMIREKIRGGLGEEAFNAMLRAKLMAHLVRCSMQSQASSRLHSTSTADSRRRVTPGG